jgi:hypothetical protein
MPGLRRLALPVNSLMMNHKMNRLFKQVKSFNSDTTHSNKRHDMTRLIKFNL